MPRGTSPKREREYEELEERFHEEGRYPGREKEVAARIVNKQRAMYGKTKEDKEQERTGTDADRNLPIEQYRTKTIPRIAKKAKNLTPSQIDKVEQFEKKHKHRKGAEQALERIQREKKGKKAA